jgi:hypothetical protein
MIFIILDYNGSINITAENKKNLIEERTSMKRIPFAVLCLFAVCPALYSPHAESMLSLKIGTTWPQALLSTGICSGDAELNYGALIDRKIGFGFATDFLWNTKEKDVKDLSTNKYRTVSADKSFMFPIMGYFLLDPVPDLIVHPVGKFEIGYNSMIFVTKSVETANSSITQVNYPYFYGLIIKGSIDALYDLGERSSLFLGVEYQWANMRNWSKGAGEFFDKRDMSGIGLRGGFRVVM